ncbi:hypothetical protein PV325_011727 [Microctonus aethiopoides]|uniref:Tyrosine-protein phosphatase non-receptor type 23 n=1 Tax=Microctonus aethiopoides TaxID=144406 RepID=A0AA39KKG6_9HYME|nr:hypothetical protein PV325_011727 [Microctonus aethiopoides]KAK0164815.1 hypothetical protein PV328_003389 [Microctonus aethiopoides]
MEAVPRLPMIWFQLKVSPEPTSFSTKLKQYIRDFYNEDPESYTNEIHQLENLRNMAVRPPIAVTGCSLLKKYYCQLHFVQSRFPMGNDEPAAVSFSWRDAYANMVFNLSNIRFEIISILYNIGAIHTQLGAKTERTSADGMKMACSHFQCAAWAFEYLQNSYPQPPGVDMSPDVMKFMHQLCLAQAQECILEKSMLDNRKPTIVAKVAKQIVDYYALALRTLELNHSGDHPIVDTIGFKFYNTVKSYVKFKRSYYMAVTLLYQGLASEEQQKMGERVAFYNAALASLNTARNIHTGIKFGSAGITGVQSEKEAFEDAIVFTNDVIEGKRKAAKNENEFIYHEEVPDKDALPTVNGASLVKGISFNVNDPEISGPDIFARLIPMKVHEASSLYSEEKAKILRSVGTKIEEKDQLLEMYLASLKLQHLSLYDPDSSSVDVDNLPIPEELAERCAALNAKPTAIQDLEDVMVKLSTTYGDVETMLKDINKLLTEEDQKEKIYQETVGKRPPSIVATDLTREAKKYEEAHAKASESNQALHRAMSLHLNNLQVLSQPLNELMASIPSTSGGAKIESEAEKQNVRELKRILGKVEEMQRQRSELYSKLRDSISQDNLTRILVTATAESTSLDTLFSEQLEKHQSLVNLIDQNLAAQDNVLSALTDAYARTAETRKSVEEIIKRRDLMISSLMTSYDTYEDLLAKSSKGLEFYRKLEVNVTKLLQRVKSTCRVQEEEREQILARNGNDNGVDSTVSVPEKKIGSGMKLKDHLASRLKNNSAYSTTYGDKQTVPMAPCQPGAMNPPMAEYSADKILGSDSIPVHAVPPVNPDPQLQDPSMYQYYPYTNYYTGQRNLYTSQQYPVYDSTNYVGMNQSLPRSGTTNSDNMYHQAGASSTTEVSGNNVQYAGYNNVRSDQVSVPSTNQPQYPIHTGYEESNNFSQYPIYNTNQGYQVSNAAYSNAQGQQLNYVQSQPTNNLPPNQSLAHISMPNQQIGQTQSINIPQNPVPQSSAIVQQYEPTIQVPNHETYINSYRGGVQNESAPSDNPINYSTINQENINKIPSTSQPPSQIHPPADNSNFQYVTPNPQQTPNSGQVVNSNYTVQDQYLSNQTPGNISNDASMRAAYSGSPSNIPSTNSIDQQHLYHPNTQSNTIQPSTAYVLPSQQGYIDQTTVVAQPNVSNPQVSMTPPPQTYSNAYGQTYSPDTNNHQYQVQQVSSNPIATQGITMTYANDPEIIQSHTKSSNIQGYLQNYQYSLQDQQTGGIGQYPNYSQGYNTTWDNKQIHNSMSDSYKGHPGYSFDMAAGNYQYSSGYQDSQNGSQQNSAETSGNNQANSHYTSANNAATTNLTSSQYSNGTYQPNVNDQNYYNSSYNDQVSREGTNDSANEHYTQTYMPPPNNGTVTSKTEIAKSDDSVTKPKSNLDLLADLDITINHAPLLPVIPPSDKEQKYTTNSSTPDLPEDSSEKKDNDMANLQIDDKHENLQIVWDTWYNDVQPKKDPLGDPLILQKFITDIEKYEKFVDSLTVKTLSGSTNLDIKWKEIQDFEERECKKQTSNVALTHSNENRSSDWIPYDSTRVKLSSLDRSSDYINASHVKDLTQWTPTFIVTQAPKSQNFDAFWSMIWEQGSEVIACLCNDTQLNGDIYWPTNKEIDLSIGNFTLSLKNSTNHTTHIQRVIGIVNSERKIERTVVHMQYLGWPSTGLPSSPGPLLSFATDIMSEQALRHCPKPIVIHCLVGGPLSSLFLLAAATVCHVRAGHGVIDVPLVYSTLVKYRRCLINKEWLLFGYRMVRYHAQDTLMKRGILSSTKSTFDGFDGIKGKPTNKHRHPSDDFLHNLGVGIQHGLSRQPGKEQTTGPTTITVKSEEKTDGTKPVDPLSQLDPLWSIRR